MHCKKNWGTFKLLTGTVGPPFPVQYPMFQVQGFQAVNISTSNFFTISSISEFQSQLKTHLFRACLLPIPQTSLVQFHCLDTSTLFALCLHLMITSPSNAVSFYSESCKVILIAKSAHHESQLTASTKGEHRCLAVQWLDFRSFIGALMIFTP